MTVSGLPERWRSAVRRVCDSLTNGEAPRFPVDQLAEFEKLFIDESGEECDLDPEEFMDGFQKIVGGHYHRSQWMKLFVDIDADRGGTVSWDEFTTFMVHQSVGLVAEYNRAKEYVPLPPPKLQYAHKDAVRRFIALEKTGHFASSAGDDTVRIWDSSLGHVQTIHNAKNSATSELVPYVASVPISDISASGSVCAVASVDKCINLYNVDGMPLMRRYIGRNLFNDTNFSPIVLEGTSKLVDTCILMGMSDGLASAEFFQLPSGRELFFTGLMDGNINVYPVMRHSGAQEIAPVLSVPNAHVGSISKVRYEHSFGHIISAGWDKTISIIDVETGKLTTRFEGLIGSSEKSTVVGHSKSISDFSYHEGSKTLASVSSERDICLWNPAMATPIQKLTGHTGQLCSVRFNDNENQLISLSQDNMIKVWDLRTYRTFQTLVFNSNAGHQLSSIYCDQHQGRLIGVAGAPFSWCVRRKFCGFPSSYRSHIEPIAGACYHKDLDVLVTTDQCTHMTWDIKNGQRLLVWDGVKEPQRFAATCLDYSGRRLCAATKDGSIFIYNHRSGQLMREEKVPMNDVLACIYIARLPNHIYLAIVSADKVCFLKELADNDFEVIQLPSMNFHFITATVGPGDAFGVPTLVLGCTDGGLVTISATLKGIVSSIPPPPPSTNEPLQEFAGDRPISKQIEDVDVLLVKGLIATVCGDRNIYFWSTGKRGMLLAILELGNFVSLSVALAHNTSETRLFCGDDTGRVHIYDIERVPHHHRRSHYHSSQLHHLTSFQAHRCSVQRIMCLSPRGMIVVTGTNLKLKLLSFSGEPVGIFGEDEWDCPKHSRLIFPDERTTTKSRVRHEIHESVFLTDVGDVALSDYLPLVDGQPKSTLQRASTMYEPHRAKPNHMRQINELHRSAMTPSLTSRKRDGIVKRSFTPMPIPSSFREESHLAPHLDVQEFSPNSTLRAITGHGNRSPTRWREAMLATVTPSLRPIASLRDSANTQSGVAREWVRLKPDFDRCRGEQRSETSKKIFDARRKNPTGWSSYTVSSYLPVEPLPPSALEVPKGSKKLPPLFKRN